MFWGAWWERNYRNLKLVVTKSFFSDLFLFWMKPFKYVDFRELWFTLSSFAALDMSRICFGKKDKIVILLENVIGCRVGMKNAAGVSISLRKSINIFNFGKIWLKDLTNSILRYQKSGWNKTWCVLISDLFVVPRSSRLQVFDKKTVLRYFAKYFAKFTEKHQHQRFFFNKVANWTFWINFWE